MVAHLAELSKVIMMETVSVTLSAVSLVHLMDLQMDHLLGLHLVLSDKYWDFDLALKSVSLLVPM